MAKFIGYVQGNRGEASRLGSRDSGIKAQAQTWEMGGNVSLWHYKPQDRDNLTMAYNTGSNGGGSGTSIIHVIREKGEVVSVELNMNAAAEIMGFKIGDRVGFKLPAMFSRGEIVKINGNTATVKCDHTNPIEPGGDFVEVPFDRCSMWLYKEPESE
jgi:hypothetical protein